MIYRMIFELGLEIVLFIVLTLIGMFILKKIRNSPKKTLKPHEYLPEDEIHTLRQVYYLIMMSFSFINLFYSLIFTEVDWFYFAIFDVAMSLMIAVTLDKSSLKNKILLILLVPYGSFNFIIFGEIILFLFDLIHVLVFIYFVKFYYDKFRMYTESHGLGITIILLFSIIFVSFFITQFVENKNPLDAIVMVSNAFTSNGYAVLGNSVFGKVNSIFLAWGGYIISGVGTATLTATILLKHFNKRVRKLEKLIEEGECDD